MTGERARLTWGIVRRFFLTRCRPVYVRRQVEQRRKGSCKRCGACCKILFRCPFLIGENRCSIYEERPGQCRAFPIDGRDLQDVQGCGFSFERPVPLRAPVGGPLRRKAFALALRLLALLLPL